MRDDPSFASRSEAATFARSMRSDVPISLAKPHCPLWTLCMSLLRFKKTSNDIPRVQQNECGNDSWQRRRLASARRSNNGNRSIRWGSFPLALPRGREAATFVRSTPGTFGTPSRTSCLPRIVGQPVSHYKASHDGAVFRRPGVLSNDDETQVV